MKFESGSKIVVVGLGYVGLPLAVALAEHFRVVGLDIDEGRVSELRQGLDRTGEISSDRLKASSLEVTADAGDATNADLYIVTVPTPVDEANRPDLRPVVSAARSVAKMMSSDKETLIVFESTVYPGVTEDICGPLIEEVSGLTRGRHFWLGYSPERINPGDRTHTVDKIVKVVAGENDETTALLSAIYGKVTSAGVFAAASIKAAEAAKVIENAQRDINIAFMNEVSRIFSRADISVWDVLEAARTKWNFLDFQPGLVGGHCIGVDPYYLSHLAQQLGHEPEVILAGRKINDGMGGWIAQEVARQAPSGGRALVLGMTFKENVPDIRNSRVIDVIEGLKRSGFDVVVHDPLADPAETQHEYGITLCDDALTQTYEVVIGAVPHEDYRNLSSEDLSGLVATGGVLADLKGMWRGRALPGIRRWSL